MGWSKAIPFLFVKEDMQEKEFYTSVEVWGNDILTRGYKNGVRFHKRVQYKPKLYIETNKDTKFKSILGRPLEEASFDSIKEARKFTEDYKGVSNFKFYGMEKWVLQYISDTYWKPIDYDFSKIRICYLDIETDSGPNMKREIRVRKKKQ